MDCPAIGYKPAPEFKGHNEVDTTLMQNTFAKRALQLLFNLTIALALLWGVWLIARSLGEPSEPQSDAPDATLRATPVETIKLAIEDEIFVQRRFLGRLEARQAADIAFEFGGTINALPVREGDRVRKGETLASLSIEATQVARATAQASLEAAQSQFDFAAAEAERVERLVSRGATQASRLDQVLSESTIASSRLKEAQSALDQVDLRLKQSELIAPFDGIIGARGASLGETVTAGQTVVSLFDSSGTDFRVGLPTSLDPATLRNPRITLNGTTYDVTLKAVRPDIDFLTNTRTAIFQVETDEVLSFGLSATLSGDVAQPLRGAWVPIDAMRPSAEGYWIILAVDDNGVAQRVAVEIQHLREDEAFVTGAFDADTTIVGAGAHKVVPGQSVRAN